MDSGQDPLNPDSGADDPIGDIPRQQMRQRELEQQHAEEIRSIMQQHQQEIRSITRPGGASRNATSTSTSNSFNANAAASASSGVSGADHLMDGVARIPGVGFLIPEESNTGLRFRGGYRIPGRLRHYTGALRDMREVVNFDAFEGQFTD